MLNSEQIIKIVNEAVFERSLIDVAFEDITIREDYDLDFMPPEYSNAISLYTEVDMVISESLGYGDTGNTLILRLSSISCIKDKEIFSKELSLSLDEYSNKYHFSLISNRMSCINRMSDNEIIQIKNSSEFTIKFTSKFPYYELINVV